MPTRTDISQHRRRSRRGYSLVELLVASASAAMLMGGLASALFLSGEALAPDHVSINASDASRVLATLRDDLRHATRITQLSGTSATFYTADRDGDGQQEKLRYAWSGEAGAPLVFEYNDGGEQTLITSVQTFELTGMTRQFFAPALTAGEDAPKLMFIVSDENSVTENEAAQFALFGGWGFDVTLVKQDEKSKDLEKEADKSAVDRHLERLHQHRLPRRRAGVGGRRGGVRGVGRGGRNWASRRPATPRRSTSSRSPTTRTASRPASPPASSASRASRWRCTR